LEKDSLLDTEAIIAELEAERDRLDEAIAALRTGKGRARRKGRRPLSAAARKRISEAQKKRWAARKERKSRLIRK
jgi:exonuclease VII small subunit